MSSWRRILGHGFLNWLVPFLIAFLAFPFREPARPLFESIMAVAVTGSAVVLGLLYLRRLERRFLGEGIKIGMVWLVMSILIDAPLMLLAGPMKMTPADYLADIGVTYLCIPIVTIGLGFARRAPVKAAAAGP